jgi:hypothetical protein
MLHLIYRAYGGENKKGRPPFYSKLLAVASLARALRQLEPGSAEAIFICDGPMPADRLAVMQSAGEVLRRSNLGLKGSLQTSLALPVDRKWPATDLVWFAEDDYLYQPHAFQNLLAAAAALPQADYLALYAQIGHMPPSGALANQGWVPQGWQGSEPVLVQGHPWRRALTTTSTFGARVKPLLEDRRMMHVAMHSGGAWDHTTYLMLQGYRPYMARQLLQQLAEPGDPKLRLKRAALAAYRVWVNGYQTGRNLTGFRPRTMMAADPALITHMETRDIALGTDWPAVAQQTLDWLAEQGVQATAG